MGPVYPERPRRERPIAYGRPVTDSPAAPAPHTHCSSCGARHRADAGWPRTCPSCGTTAYRNPLPVAIALLPVTTGTGSTALVVITRTIPPAAGQVALPGGFIDFGEDWQHAVARELYEETGIPATADEVRLADALSSPAGHLLVLGLLPPRPADTLPPPAPTDETTGHHLLHGPEELAFPLHTEAVRRFFSGAYDR
ncbi:NUDIX domain-containing protein [Streptomyces sp. NPDC090025]|uniref:NUDIX domain-containing protein n=1 Tax=Streptomyces sp. NPDC090025 TaxID=3365922 RepID=UPI003839762F